MPPFESSDVDDETPDLFKDDDVPDLVSSETRLHSTIIVD